MMITGMKERRQREHIHIYRNKYVPANHMAKMINKLNDLLNELENSNFI